MTRAHSASITFQSLASIGDGRSQTGRNQSPAATPGTDPKKSAAHCITHDASGVLHLCFRDVFETANRLPIMIIWSLPHQAWLAHCIDLGLSVKASSQEAAYQSLRRAIFHRADEIVKGRASIPATLARHLDLVEIL